MPLDTSDFFSKHGAGLLADAINAYWAARGHKTVRAERYRLTGADGWGVRSNLVMGLPPRTMQQWGVLAGKSLVERRREFLG